MQRRTSVSSLSAVTDSLLARALDSVGESSLVSDASQNTIYVNEAFCEATGYSSDEVIGRNCRFLQGPDTSANDIAAIRAALASGQVFRGQILNYRKDGSTFWNSLTISPLFDAGGEISHFVSVQRDVSLQVELQTRLAHQALHDPLTGLANRAALDGHLDAALATARRRDKAIVVGIIDLDEFKSVNDELGHLAGDTLLEEFARRLRTKVRRGDYLARLGGDEFVVVLHDLDKDDPHQELGTILTRLGSVVARPFELDDDNQVHVGMSMGLAVFPFDAFEGEGLLRRADVALYQAKSRPPESAKWWSLWADQRSSPPPDTAPATAVQVERDREESPPEPEAPRRPAPRSTAALPAHDLVTFMQPIVNLRTGAVAGVEAFLRIRSRNGKLVPTSELLASTAQDQLSELFRLGLDRSAEWLTRWDAQGVTGLQLSINVPSTTLLAPDFPHMVEGILLRHGLSPERLSLETVETEHFESPRVHGALNSLAALGVTLSLDDLGAAYSNVRLLADLPFDAIKIDGGLYDRLHVKPLQTLALVAAIVELGKDSQRQVIADGLEDDGMTEVASILGADYGQGPSVARPMSPDAVVNWVRQFRMPTERGVIRTFTGALAYHWRYMRTTGTASPSWEQCPLTAFLGTDHSDAARLHRSLHTPGTDQDHASRVLVDWLVQQVCDRTD